MPQFAQDQWTLGNLIEALAKRPLEEQVKFDFCGLVPTHLASYRGFYEDLALGFMDRSSPPCLVSGLLEEARAAVGCTFHGYKGGDILYSLDSALWVACWGDTSSTILVGVEEDTEGETILRTRWMRS